MFKERAGGGGFIRFQKRYWHDEKARRRCAGKVDAIDWSITSTGDRFSNYYLIPKVTTSPPVSGWQGEV
ncbi:MAG: hypothetical protein ACREYC_22415 [Gammaproteobacteria bacterium]